MLFMVVEGYDKVRLCERQGCELRFSRGVLIRKIWFDIVFDFGLFRIILENLNMRLKFIIGEGGHINFNPPPPQ